MPAFRDLFAFAAGSYARYRPRYPAALFRWLGESVPRHECAWDCGTGSGQAAVALASNFDHVIATDPSITQLAHADRAGGVCYAAMTAEDAALGTASADLVTVAQALHWFQHDRFFAEVDRVLRPGGALAVWSYGVLAVDPRVDPLLRQFYFDELGPHWPVERALVDSGYAGIALPFAERATPAFEMVATWNLAQLGGYLSTWSAVGRCRAATGRDPLPDLMRRLSATWDADETRSVRWPLVVRLARKHA